jgi:hypothetical protein
MSSPTRSETPIIALLERRPGNVGGVQFASPTPPVSLRSYALAAVAAYAYDAISAAAETVENRFLLAHLDAVDAERLGWTATLPEYLQQPLPADAPLIRLAQALDLTVFEMLAVALGTAVEEDVMAGRALAHLQSPLGGSRPTVGLLAAALAETIDPRMRPTDALVTGVAMRSGLLALAGESAPLPERTVSVPLHLCLALSGHDGAWPGAAIGLDGTPEVPLPRSTVEEAQNQARALHASPERALVLRTGSQAEGRATAALVAQALDCRPLFVETEETGGLSPWLILRRLLPVFCLELGPGERKALPTLPCYRGPVLALCGPDGSVEAAGGAALGWSIPVPPREERQALWQIALGNGELARDLAYHHRHGSGRIAHLGRLARHHGILDGREQPTREDVMAASWAGEGGGLDALTPSRTRRW